MTSASYRLQITPEFTLDDACAVVSYLAALGISDCYCSPIFAARPGSDHGYDVIDMGEVNRELGGRDALERLSTALRQQGMRWLQDIVPNHCAFHGANRDLMDVLELGPHSRFYRHYDVFWEHPYANIRGRILAPFLGDFYGRCLERGELQLRFGEGGFSVDYFDFSLPLALESYGQILSRNLERLAARFPPVDLTKLQALVRLLGNLDSELEAQPAFDYSSFVKELLWELCGEEPAIREHVEQNLSDYNGGDGNFELLDQLLDEQHFRLSFWKVGTEELNYRRFFSINDLISLRIEEDAVLDHTHRLVFDLVGSGRVQGVRVDHVDGLYDPTAYLQRLRGRFPDLAIVVEKVLQTDEDLPPSWPVEGTTGYDFLDRVTGVLCDRAAGGPLERTYRRFAKLRQPYAQLVQQNKRGIVKHHMAGDIDNLALLLKDITNKSRDGNDLTMHAVRRALVEVLTLFPVYRTYVNQQSFDDVAMRTIDAVLASGRQTAPRFRNELELLGSFIRRVHDREVDDAEREEWIRFLMRLQQYTSPLMAKGVEDTTFYQYYRLVSRNEVGCDPTRMGFSADEWHGFAARRSERWPAAMNATATHDTKRGEDVRARLNVIAEDPVEWQTLVNSWHRVNRRHRRRVARRECPTANDEYLVYQTVLGAAPFAGFDADDFGGRLERYLVKAAREGKQQTSWLNPDDAYERALVRFAARILDGERSADFHRTFLPYLRRVSFFGIFNSLAQCLLKVTSPGVPDVYQGTELWDLNLVDPDNRRPVDFGVRAELLRDLEQRVADDRAGLVEELAAAAEDGRIKLYLLRCALALRRAHPLLFLEGSYERLVASGPRARHLLGFCRRQGERVAVSLVTRFGSRLQQKEQSLRVAPPRWEGTRLALPDAGRSWRERLTGAEVEGGAPLLVGELLPQLPVALWTNF